MLLGQITNGAKSRRMTFAPGECTGFRVTIEHQRDLDVVILDDSTTPLYQWWMLGSTDSR